MDDDQQFCLRWNNHQSTLISVFDTLLENETLVDCTLAAEGRFLKAHKVVLSACSPYFAKLLQEQYDKHPIFILKDVKFQELRAMMDYMYRGEVNISQDQLAALLKAAESLQIKGLSDNRGAPRQEQPLRSTMPVGKNSYTLEQTKRARMGPGAMEPQDVSGSREGSSSPSRRRRKVRRRSMENDVHDNSNSSINQQTQPSNANLAGVSAITAAALASQISAAGSSVVSPATIASAVVGSQQPGTTQLTTSVPKKTDSNKGTSDAMNTENLQAAGTGTTSGGVTTTANIDDEDSEQQHMSKTDPKSNHKQKSKDGSTISTGDMTIEPKSEYDEEGNEESVEDLTLDEEMGMEDLDHNAGTSQGGEGSSQGYAWQHDRSQDELLLTTQDAQQRDPQDLSRKIIRLKENPSPLQSECSNSNPRSLLISNKIHANRHSSNGDNVTTFTPSASATSVKINGNTLDLVNRKRLSMSDVSDMLFEFYKANVAKAPKSQPPQPGPQALEKLGRQTSPTSAEQINEPSTIAAIAINGAASETASKNLKSDEMMPSKEREEVPSLNQQPTSFHQRLRLTPKGLVNAVANDFEKQQAKIAEPIMTAIPTSVLVPISSQIDVKPLINPTTGIVMPSPEVVKATTATVIKSVPSTNASIAGCVNPQAAAIAAALLRDGYHSFQQQIRAQEILKQQNPQRKSTPLPNETPNHSKILESLLRQQQHQQQQQHQREQRTSECENEPDNLSENNDGDDEDDSRFNGFEDIHLMEGGKSSSANNSFTQQGLASGQSTSGNDLNEDPQKLLLAHAQAQVLRNLEYSLGDYGGGHGGSSSFSDASPTGIGPDGEPIYECRHCGKKYRWKSTLRRHENVECGGKEPSHQCPYCPYKSKQRGNLGVHVRKHHSNLPQLASKRRSKYSMKYEEGSNPGSIYSGATSDDSQSKLVIDCSK